MPPRRITPAQRAAIIADIEAGKKRNQIARDHKVAAATVTKIAQESGAQNAFDRASTVKATQARMADTAAERAEVVSLFLRRAKEELDQLDQPCLVYSFGGKDNTYNEHILDRPTPSERRTILTSAAIAFDKHLAGVRHDVSADAGAVGALLTDLFEDLRTRHDPSS